jgi:molybdate transport repressor ModE-like protein
VLDVRRMQMLRAVAREGSLSAAARTLGYTQPAVSHHIARLEEEVGTALLTRLGRGVQLTDAGLALVDHADAVLARLGAAEEEVAAIAGLRAGRVRIAAFPSGCATLMAGALSRLRADHPGVEVTFVEAEPPDALPLLRRGDADLVLGFTYAAVGERDPRDFESIPLMRDPSHAVLPQDHPVAVGGAPTPPGPAAGPTRPRRTPRSRSRRSRTRRGSRAASAAARTCSTPPARSASHRGSTSRPTTTSPSSR